MKGAFALGGGALVVVDDGYGDRVGEVEEETIAGPRILFNRSRSRSASDVVIGGRKWELEEEGEEDALFGRRGRPSEAVVKWWCCREDERSFTLPSPSLMTRFDALLTLIPPPIPNPTPFTAFTWFFPVGIVVGGGGVYLTNVQ